jgi:hypothetical protein
LEEKEAGEEKKMSLGAQKMYTFLLYRDQCNLFHFRDNDNKNVNSTSCNSAREYFPFGVISTASVPEEGIMREGKEMFRRVVQSSLTSCSGIIRRGAIDICLCRSLNFNVIEGNVSF